MEPVTPQSKLQILKIIHLALMGGVALFGAVVFFLNFNGSVKNMDGQEIFLYLPSVVFIVAFLASGPLFKIMLRSGKVGAADLDQKLAVYQTAHIARMALFEAAGMVAGVSCFVTGTLQNLVWLVLIIAYFLLKIPTVYRLENELGLTVEEKAQFD